MKARITADVVVAYSHCPRKGVLVLRQEERGDPHEYASILDQQRQASRVRYLDAFARAHPDAVAGGHDELTSGAPYLTHVTLTSADADAIADVLTRVGTSSGQSQYEPTLVMGTHTITPEQKLEVTWVGYVLGQVQGKLPMTSYLVDIDGRAHKLDLSTRYAALRTLLRPLRSWAGQDTADLPPVILNRYCPLCPFRGPCREQAERTGDLSLLDRMTPKTIQRYHRQGIFTVMQLSYRFRPRRSKKSRRAAQPGHKLEMQALAITTGKTYVNEVPHLSRQPMEFFLDIEGKPDEQSYYLIGLLVWDGRDAVQHTFWADTPSDEAVMFERFLQTAATAEDAPIYHYGNYESVAIDRMSRRYQVESDALSKLKRRMVNLTTEVHGKVYFPVRSNSLKDIGRFLGVTWNVADPSGLQSLVRRHRWEQSHGPEDQHWLVSYNAADCRALKVLLDELSHIADAPDTELHTSTAGRPSRAPTADARQLHDPFEAIIKAGHMEYDRKKIILRQDEPKDQQPHRPGGVIGHVGHTREVNPRSARSQRVVHVASPATCPVHTDTLLLITERPAETRLIDLVCTPSGWKKVLIRYVGSQAYCPTCARYYRPPEIVERDMVRFGHGFRSWVMYHRLALRLPYRAIVQAIEDEFNEKISQGTIVNFLRGFSTYYAATEIAIIERVCVSPVVHVDETKISIRGDEQWVWVFTDGKHVFFRLTKTREAAIVHQLLGDYQGVLVSDFYAGYDALPCKQQKCLVHLIRDINDDLWEAPFDRELAFLAAQFRDLLTSIFQAVDRYGLKQRHLSRFLHDVERFYRTAIDGANYSSEFASKYHKRFDRYRDSLFTFLQGDAIPWNNNMAERAIRHLAVQRKISGWFHEDVTPDYLRMLGITQTCRFQDKSLLRFLVSGERDIDAFEASKRSLRRAPAAIR